LTPRVEAAIRQQANLTTENSFGVPCHASELFCLSDSADLPAACDWLQQHPDALILGGGSNLLIATPTLSAVLAVRLKGRSRLNQAQSSNEPAADNNTVLVQAAAGENWHEFVCWTLEQQLFGLENLSLIPGSCGAAPVQNIGAYGVELADCLHAVNAIHISSGEQQRFGRDQCGFGYRTSRFKESPGQWLILSIELALHRQPTLHLDYGDIREQLQTDGIDTPSAHDVAAAVCAIRRRKLPDPAELGNAGSFFKNPVISSAQFEQSNADLQGIAHWPIQGDQVKLAAGALIEACDLKGFRRGDAGVHAAHALVLVNHGNASGEQILELANEVCRAVQTRFGILLEPEPLIIRSA
jgi:UDP-N-acetylmuramate dehydrogenase